MKVGPDYCTVCSRPALKRVKHVGYCKQHFAELHKHNAAVTQQYDVKHSKIAWQLQAIGQAKRQRTRRAYVLPLIF